MQTNPQYSNNSSTTVLFRVITKDEVQFSCNGTTVQYTNFYIPTTETAFRCWDIILQQTIL